MSKRIRFSASGAFRWTECPASPHRWKPTKSSKFAQEGTDAAAEAERILKEYIKTGDSSYLAEYEIGMYLDYILKNSVGCTLLVEEDLYVNSIDKEKTKSRPDCVIIDLDLCSVEVIDLKYGVGQYVGAFENNQLAFYSAAIAEKYPEIEDFKMTIVQPRHECESGPIRSWELSRDELINVWVKKFKKAYDLSMRKKHLGIVGDWCKWCPAIDTCPDLKECVTDLNNYEVNDDTFMIAKFLDAEKAINEKIKAIKAKAYELIGEGTKIPGYKIVMSKHNTMWKDTGKVREEITELQLYDKNLKTPTQLKKEAKGDENVLKKIKNLSHRPDKGPVLAKESDKRPSANVKDDFKEELDGN